jgi:hypothetical protein
MGATVDGVSLLQVADDHGLLPVRGTRTTVMNLSDSMEVLPNLMKILRDFRGPARFTQSLPEIDGQDLRHFQQGWTN